MLSFTTILLIYLITSKTGCCRPIQEITETRDSPETQIPEDFSNAISETLKPTEIQKAVCTVTSGDVRASAEAFTTRELKGVCGSTEMLKAFTSLENKLSEELQNIKKLVQELHSQFVLQNSVEPNLKEQLGEPVTSSSLSNNIATSSTFKFQAIPLENEKQKTIEKSNKYNLAPMLKSLPTKGGVARAPIVREKEVSQYNNTISTNKYVKVYTYYWRLENFTQNIKSGKSLSMESPLFSIKGKAFKIVAHFQHLYRDYLYLQLEDYSSAPVLSSGNSIVLDTGDVFKEISSEHFKYKMSILDQNKKRYSDLVSQEFDNFETGFSIPNSALIDSPFIKNNSLLIQLLLYI